MTSTYGLPRYVANFLSHMEVHKDCLKWNITETSHKIHLTLTWNFRKHKGKETLWDKLQRTLKFSRSMDIDSPSTIPPDLSQFLEASPKKIQQSPPQQQQQQQQKQARPPLQRQQTWNGPFRRPFNWSKYSSYSLPGTRASTPRHTLRHSQSLQEPPPPPRATSVSPSRGSWSGDLVHSDSVSPRHSTPMTSTPNLTRSDSSTYSPATPPRVKLTYRTTEDMDRSMEDVLVRTRQRTKVKLESIRREWNRTIRDWPQVLEREAAATSGPASVINPPSDSEHSTDSLPEASQTVQNCLRSCDNILYRYSTDIT